ncbi:MAG: acyltransferase, partial [Myxococcota bacterium]|nr:acyltransferase [Myxococcota bacterium]
MLAVVAYHANVPFVTGGFVGVDVFFVISGFLITNLLIAEQNSKGRISLLNFYVRRVRRILPAFLLVIVGTLILSWIFLYPVNGEQQTVAKSAIAALLLSANHFFYSTISYFNNQAEQMPLLHLWSLSVEEQFYVVWPLLLLLLSDRRRLLLVLIAVWIASFALSVWLVIWDQSAAFFLMPARAWELATGALLAFFIPASSSHGSKYHIGIACSLLGITMIFASIFLLDRATPFPGAAALLPVIGTALVIWGNAAAARSWVALALSYRPIVFVGLISYSLYLWHWPLLTFANAETLGQPHPLLVAGLVTLAFMLSWMTYRFVEVPFRRSTQVLALGQWQTLRFATAGCVLVLTIGALFGLYAQEKAARWDLNAVNSQLGKWPEYAD